MTDGNVPSTSQVRANMLVDCQDDQSEPEGGFDLNRQKNAGTNAGVLSEIFRGSVKIQA